MSHNSSVTKFLGPAVGAFALALLVFHGVFSRFFPTPNGTLGHDYSLAIPGFYDGLIWFKNNALWDIPWFSPSFCGGQPFYADPQSGYFSLPQWLLFGFEPVTGLYLNLLALAVIAYWGAYLLARRLFGIGPWLAALAGVIFMCNSFLTHRMLVGHLGFQGVVLIPWLALLLAQRRELPLGPITWGGSALLSGLMIAYWLQSGFGTLMVPAALAVFALACLYGVLGNSLLPFFLRSAAAALLALALSASKLMASLAFMSHFPRSDYLLPGIAGLWSTLEVALKALTLSSVAAFATANGMLVNSQWFLGPHEWSYSVTPVPLVLLLVALVLRLIQRLTDAGAEPHRLHWGRILSGVGLVGVLVLPIALNVYTPEWNAFLKQLPLIKTTASPCRWFMIYIPILTIGSVVAVHQARHLRSADKWIGGAGILLVLLWVALENRGIYFTLLEAGYNPASAELAWERLQEGETPRLSGVAQVGPPLRPGGAPLMRNDLVFAGLSQATCYNPVFGYRLEHLPTGPLHMGPALSDNGKIFNIKNPACYVWPKENRCQPGDHFRVNQREQAEAFVSYHPWQFAISSTQRWANRITEVGLVLTLVLGLLSLLWPRVASSGLGKQ